MGQIAGIRQAHGASFFMRVKPIVNAFVLQQSRDKAIVRLLMLHAVTQVIVRSHHIFNFGFFYFFNGAIFKHGIKYF